MIKITIQAGSNTYLVASKTTGVDGVGIYQGRLLNEVVLSRRFSKAGNAPVTLNISIRNNDGFIPRSVNLWAAAVTIVSNSGHQWSGKITAYDRDDAGILRLVVTEKAAPELTIQFPDEVARLVTVDENFHVSALNVTLPLVVGGNAEKPILVKGVLIDKVRGIYLLCVGENHQVVNVYRGTEKLTTGFSAFTGTATQTEYSGFAYVELTDAALRKNDDNSYVEISADVVGLKLGSHSVEECRNGARFLQYLLNTPKDGACGWGLGIGSSEIDATAFSAAIARVDAASLKMDGVFYFRQLAQSWIDQICQAIRGCYEIGENGQRRLFVNADSASTKTYTKKNMKLLRDGKGAFTGQVYNRGRLDFDYNPLTGQFMQHVDYEDDTGSIADIGELDFSGQSYLIRDMATAQAILEYTCKRSLIGADKVYFKTRELPANVHTGTIITIDYPEKALSGTWQIISIDLGSFVHEIEAEKFSSSIFVVGTPGTAIAWSGDAPVVSPVLPGAASGLSLETDVEYDANGDGSAIPYISGTFTLPEGKYLGAAVFWGEGASPSVWNNVTIKGNEFRIKPVRAGQQYTVKVQMFNQSGTSTAIIGSIVAGSHAAIPPTPTISTATGLGCIVVNIAISAFAALSHFEIQRQKSDGSGLTNVASEYRGTCFTDDDAAILSDYENLYQYRVRSVSRSGRTSAWTSLTTAISATQLRNKDVSADQFIGKHFTTACNVGAGQNGVMFNAQGLQAWCNGVKTVDIPTSGNPVFSGTITAEAGCIGGWSIGPSWLAYRDIDGVTNRNLALSPGEKSMYFYMGSPDSGAFLGQTHGSSGFTGRYGLNVKSNGAIIFEASHNTSGDLTAQIAGWSFNSQCFYANNLILNSGGAIQTADFVSGNRGWKIDCVGNAEFNNLNSRGAIKSAVFLKEEISVIGGNLLVRPAETLKADAAIDIGATWLYTVDTTSFAVNDYIRIKDAFGDDVWGCVYGKDSTHVYFCRLLGSYGFLATKGQSIVNYGPVGAGGIFLDGQNGYMDIYTHDGNPWNGTCSMVRLGNLCGWGAFGANYGIAIGSPTDANRLTYDTSSGKLKIVGDIEVTGNGNILPDPDFRGVPYNSDFTSVPLGTNVGEYTALGGGAYYVFTASRGEWRANAYARPNSNSIWLYAQGSGHYAGFCSKNFIPVNPGVTYTLSGYVAKHLGYDNPSVSLGVACFDAAGNQIGYNYSAISGVSISSGTPTRHSGSFTAAVGVSFVKIIAYNYYPIGPSYVYFSGLQLEEGTTLTAWKCNQGGIITADSVKAGALQSLNWGASAGSCINMDNGTFAFGGYSAPKLKWDGSLLLVNGTICSCCGNIGGWGLSATSLWVNSGSCDARSGYPGIHISSNRDGDSGASKGSGFRFVSGSTAFPEGDFGISIGECLLQPSVAWHTRKGIMISSRTSGQVLFEVSTDMDGNNPYSRIGGWSFSNGTINAGSVCGAIVLEPSMPSVYSYSYSCSGSYAMHGVMFWDGNWKNSLGFSVSNGSSGTLAAGMGYAAKGSETLPSGTVVAQGNPFFYVGNGSTSYAEYYNGLFTVKGTVCASAGCFGCFSISSGALHASSGATFSNMMLCSSTTCAYWTPTGMYFEDPASGYPKFGYIIADRTSHSRTGPSFCHYASLNAFGCLRLYTTTLAGADANTCLLFDASKDGSTAGSASMLVCTYGGTSCFAFCTNGRIQVQGTVYPSDRNLKTDFEMVSVLPMLRNSPIMKWRYKGSHDYQFGPVAQDFNPAFKLVHDWETNLTVSNLDGIALRGVQELDECVAYNNRRIIEIESRNACLETRLNCLESELMRLKLVA